MIHVRPFPPSAACTNRSPCASLAGRAPAAAAGALTRAVAVADLVNDGWAATAGLLCLAISARHDGRVLAVAVALGIAASLPTAVLMHRQLWRWPSAMGGSPALLTEAFGLSVLADPWMTRAVGAPPWLLLLRPLLCVAAVIGVSLPRRAEAVPR